MIRAHSYNDGMQPYIRGPALQCTGQGQERSSIADNVQPFSIRYGGDGGGGGGYVHDVDVDDSIRSLCRTLITHLSVNYTPLSTLDPTNPPMYHYISIVVYI